MNPTFTLRLETCRGFLNNMKMGDLRNASGACLQQVGNLVCRREKFGSEAYIVGLVGF